MTRFFITLENEIPFKAGVGNKLNVVLMIYNSTKVRYMDPLSGEEVVLEREQFEQKMKESGNEFYSYLKQ